jgi:rhodanese-related sulfurtransferase
LNKISFRYGYLSSGLLNLTPHQAFLEIKENGAVILDVRESYLSGYKRFNVPEVIVIPLSELQEKYTLLPSDVLLIVADSVGLRSHEAMEFLMMKGFNNIANLAGGIVDWERDGLPMNSDKTEQLDGSCICQLRPRHKKK